MIKDSIANANLYKNVSERIEKALTFLEENDFTNWECGKYPIDEKNIYASVSEYATKEPDYNHWEAHKNYLDIQYIVSGKETFGVAKTAELEPVTDYNDQKDITFYKGNGDMFSIEAGDFVIVWPQDAHMPNRTNSEPCNVKKVVVKVKL